MVRHYFCLSKYHFEKLKILTQDTANVRLLFLVLTKKIGGLNVEYVSGLLDVVTADFLIALKDVS